MRKLYKNKQKLMEQKLKNIVFDTNYTAQVETWWQPKFDFSKTKDNKKNNITPKSVVKKIKGIDSGACEMDYFTVPILEEEKEFAYKDKDDLIRQMEEEMLKEAKILNFERAAILRNKIDDIKMAGFKNKERKSINFKFFFRIVWCEAIKKGLL